MCGRMSEKEEGVRGKRRKGGGERSIHQTSILYYYRQSNKLLMTLPIVTLWFGDFDMTLASLYREHFIRQKKVTLAAPGNN